MTPPLPQGSSYPSYRLSLAVATCLAWKHLKLFIKSILHLTHWIKSRKMRWFSNGISITVLVVKWTRVSEAPIHVLPFWRLLTCLSWVFFVFVLFVNGILIFAVAVCRCFALEVPSSEFNKYYCQWKISIGCSKRRRGMLPRARPLHTGPHTSRDRSQRMKWFNIKYAEPLKWARATAIHHFQWPWTFQHEITGCLWYDGYDYALPSGH